jgi:hypothetical protein
MSVDNEPAPAGLPQYVRFSDLKRAGIVNNWPTLRHLIRNNDFPSGVRLSSNVRAWLVDEVRAWCATRPVGQKIVSPRAREQKHEAALATTDVTAL